MTTTELIALLQSKEKGGATGKSREISLDINIDNTDYFFSDCDFSVSSTGDGIAGAEITLKVVPTKIY